MKKITELLSIVVLFVISSGFCIPFSFWKSSCSNSSNLFYEQGNLTGSVLASTTQMSPNGQYGIAKVIEKKGANSIRYHFFYTKDSGDTWVNFDDLHGVDQYVTLLMHFDVNSGMTTYVDEINPERVFTVVGGSPNGHNASEGKFGRSGGRIGYSTPFDSWTTPNSSDFAFGTGDFTVDFWANPQTFNLSGYSRGVVGNTDGGASGTRWFIRLNPTTFQYEFGVDGAGVIAATSTSFTAAVPYHIEFTRSAGQLYVFVNGSLQGAPAAMPQNLSSTSGNFYLSKNPASDYDFPGSIDELRISKGIARHTSSFAVETRPYGLSNAMRFSVAENFGGVIHGSYKSQIAVADNGKAAIAYSANLSGAALMGYYSDLSVAAPTLEDTGGFSTDSFLSSPFGGIKGIVSYISGNNVYGGLAANSDLSNVAFLIKNVNAGNPAIRGYTNGGLTHQALVNLFSLSPITYQGTTMPLIGGFSGTTPNQRFVLFTTYQEGSPPFTVSNVTNVFTEAGAPFNASAPSVTRTVLDASALRTNYDMSMTNGRGYLFARNNSSGIGELFSFTPGLTYSFDTPKVLTSTTTVDQHLGWPDLTLPDYNAHQKLRNSVLINPADDKNVLIAYEAVHPDGIRRASAVEVRDITSFVGANISQYSQNVWRGLRDTTARTQVGQTLTTSSSRFRTVAIRLRQTGSVPAGHNITLEVQGQSGGLPNNTALATSINSYEADKITKNTSGQWCFFTVDTLSLTGSHSFVIKSTYPVSSSNYIEIAHSNSNPYSGGTSARYDGSAWTANSGEDFVFEVNGEWIYDFSTALASHVLGSAMWDQEVGVSLTSAGKAQLVTRRTNASSTSYLPVSGHVFKSELTFGTGTSASTFTTPSQAGYANYDANLVFSTQGGVNETAQKNTITGSLDANNRLEDRSGVFVATSSTNNITTTADVDFVSGTSSAFNGTNSHYTYVANDFIGLYGTNHKFVFEFEVKFTSLNVVNVIAAHGSSAATTGGWRIFTNDSGNGAQLRFGDFASDLVRVNAVFVPGTKYLVRILGDGDRVKVFFNGVEQTYATQVTGGYSITAPNAGIGFVSLGAYTDNTQNAPMRLGYFKMARNTNTFSYSGFSSQPPITKVIPISNKISAEQSAGQNSTTNGVNFDDFGIIKQVCQ
jgi:hypothetical protein